MRAGIMGIVVITASIFSKRPDTVASIGFTAFILLLFNPFIIFDVGFILSFLGTIGIVLLNSKISFRLKSKLFFKDNKVLNFIIDTLSITLSAQIVLIPVMWHYFNTVNIISLLTNLLVAPFVSFITILGILVYLISLISFPLAQFLSYSVYILLFFVISISKLCASVPFANLLVPTPSIFVIIFYYMCIYFLFFRNKKCFMNLDIVLFLLLASIISLNIVIPKPYVEINMVDVGQGDSISIKTTHGRNILIDGGGSEQSSYDVGEKVLVPYLLDNSNGVIDVMVVSHFHEDHAEGLITVLNTLKVKKIVIGLQPSNSNLYNELLRISTEKNIPVICLYQGSSFTVDDVNFEIVYPKKQIEIQDDLNNNSLVLLCKVYGKSLLLTGDAENIEEDMFIENINQRVDILKVGHHGSRTSTTQTLLERIRPKVFLISAGVDNKFGHPHEEVLNRIEKYSEHIYRTDLQGEITLRIYKNSKMSIKTKL